MHSFNMIEILLVEDNLGDIRLTEEALKENKIKVNLNIVMDGQEALNYLHKLGKYENKPTPDLILLDLNLPKKDGGEVLRQIKADPKLKYIPVVVLTISKAEQDVMRAYNLQANCYIIKPLDLNQFVSVIHELESFWFTIVKLPEKMKIAEADATLIHNS